MGGTGMRFCWQLCACLHPVLHVFIFAWARRVGPSAVGGPVLDSAHLVQADDQLSNSTVLPGICQSPKWADIIVVSLPTSAGRITPPHTASSNSVILSYEPVVPVIEVDSVLSNDTQVVMLVSLDYPSTLEVRCA